VASPEPTAPEPATPGPHGPCTATLTLEPLTIEPSTCFVDTKFKGKEGKLTYPCGGGPARARFPGVTFKGDVTGDVVNVFIVTDFDWTDGCKWRSEQHIFGRLPGGTLELALAGQAGCDPACTARATVTASYGVQHSSEAGPGQ
jgi:hypothetical protein